MLMKRAHSKSALRDHGMVQCRVRLPVSPLKYMLNKILVLPGWMNYLRMINVKEYSEVWHGKTYGNREIDYAVGFSLGALVILRDLNSNWKKIILVAPPLPKRNLLTWLINWIKYISIEGMSLRNQVFTKNPFKFIAELYRCIKLFRIDFSEILDNISKDKIIVMRGKNDNFFCDDKAVKFLHSKNIQVIEIEGVGHNWDEKFNMEIDKIISGP